MRIKTYQVYEFKELSREAKQKAIDLYYETEDYPFLSEDLTEEIHQLDTLGIFSDIKISYSLSNCQGDGLSFSASIDFLKFLNNRGLRLDEIDLLSNAVYKFQSRGNNNHYCYASKSDITYEENESHKDEVWAIIDKLKEEITDYYLDICRKVEKQGYSILEYRMTEAEFQECCESNGYEFLENGKLDY